MGNFRKSAPTAQVSSEIIQIREQKGLLFQNAFEGQSLSFLIRKHFPNYRDRIFNPTTTLFAFLSQMLSPDKSCAETVARVNAERAAQGLELISSDTSAYCKARERMPAKFIQELTRDTTLAIEEKIPLEWLWKGRKTKLIDGSTATTADTPENQAAYPQHGKQKKDIGFPITRMIAIFSLATGCILEFVNGPYQGKGTGEHGLLRQLMHCFKKDDLVVGDAYFSSYFLIAQLRLVGADCLFAGNGRRYTDFRTGERLGKRDHLVFWQKPQKPNWMSDEEYDQMPNSVQVRECTISIHRPGFRSIKCSLVTTLINPEYASSKELGWLYSRRWAAELNLAAIKTVLKMEHLRSKTPEMVCKEIWTTLLAYNLIRKIMGEAAYQHHVLPHEISFKSAVQHLNAFRPLWSVPGVNTDGSMIQKLLVLIVKRKVANRPGRVEPRAIKKRPRSFPRLHTSREVARNAIMRNASH